MLKNARESASESVYVRECGSVLKSAWEFVRIIRVRARERMCLIKSVRVRVHGRVRLRVRGRVRLRVCVRACGSA